MVANRTFLILLFTLWIGFGLALGLLFEAAARTSTQLIRHDKALMFEEQGEWTMAQWVFLTLNMGLYGHLDDGTMLLMQESVSIQIFFFVYMFIVHLVLLNLLIAIMQHSYNKSIAESQLVAKFRRARLILEQEGAPP